MDTEHAQCRYRLKNQIRTLPGGACACGLAWIALTGLAAWHPPTDFPMRFFVLPRPSFDPAGVANLGARRRSVRLDAAAADIQNRSERCHQERWQPILRGTPLGAARYAVGGADRALLRHGHVRLCLAARPRKSGNHGPW